MAVFARWYELCLESPTLGGGAFAEVFKVIDRQTTQALAVKVSPSCHDSHLFWDR